MVLPLTVPLPPMGATIGKGLVLSIRDSGGAAGDSAASRAAIDARLIAFVAIYSALGIRDDALTAALGQAMARNPFPAIKRLRRDPPDAAPTCWLHADRLCISLE